MTGPAPIIENNKGRREFLLPGEGQPPYAKSKLGPFPNAESLETVLNFHRKKDDWQEQYGIARAANNLAAAHFYTGDLEAALTALREAESKLIDMIQDGNPHPKPLTFAGLAMVKYNAAVLFWMAGDSENNWTFADDNRLGAHEALMEIGEDADEDAEFIRAALLAFPAVR
ncbi:hypothetical protein AB0J83_03405 [Actinoplanes sp. NPDC049596]|uniref:hypothetical protein n=1 Tax=unclassified Actinoplanes TaxID=2626549 RepID=UPI0034424CD2